MIEIPRKEIYRYLGYGQTIVDDRTKNKIEECVEDLQACTPRSIWEVFPIDLIDEKTVCFANVEIHSKNLAHNLKDCTKVICMATTLGLLPDRLIKRAQIQDLSKSVIYQAAACAMIEEYTDEVNNKLCAEQKKQGYYCRPRYSCGYGDFKLSHQKDFIRLLNMPKTIGVTLTEGNLMVPYKSITAIIGLSKIEKGDSQNDCSSCLLKECLYRKK